MVGAHMAWVELSSLQLPFPGHYFLAGYPLETTIFTGSWLQGPPQHGHLFVKGNKGKSLLEKLLIHLT